MKMPKSTSVKLENATFATTRFKPFATDFNRQDHFINSIGMKSHVFSLHLQ